MAEPTIAQGGPWTRALIVDATDTPIGSVANPLNITGSITASSGSLSNNNAAPSNNNTGVLPAIANAAAPTWTEGNMVLESVDLAGNQRTILKRSSTGTQSSVASSATDVTILASNTSRLNAVIFNDSTQILYLLVAAGTSSTSVYTVQVQPNGYFELMPTYMYTGVIKGLWASANGNARVTEYT